jgi:oxygen-independent coproporphyrinogen-3 oxidase
MAYVEALLRDLDVELAVGPRPGPLVSVFIGGGTPSLFSGPAIARLLAGLRQRLPLSDATEITLEANPGAADAAHFASYREAGVNRLSLGVQSLDAGRLQELGRIHGPGEARQAMRLARQVGYDNVNLDLMFALPRQDLAEAKTDLCRALELEPEHLSYYQLTLEPNTPFHAAPPPLPDEDLSADMLLQGLELLADAGFTQYEVSAHARPGRHCRHNLNYWTFGDYLGIGAGAHGKLTDPVSGRVQRRAKPRHPTAYLDALGIAGQVPMRPIGTTRGLDENDLVLEFAMNALRLTEGFELPLFRRRTGLEPSCLAGPLDKARRGGLVEVHDHWVSPTERGRWFLTDLIAHFMAAVTDR